MAFKGGNRRTGETTILLGDQNVLKGKNFIPDSDGVSVRPGITIINKIAQTSSQVESRVPIAIESVNISGEDILLMVGKTGTVEVVFPRKTGMIYKLYRRFYDVEDPVTLSDQINVPNYADIIQVGNFIYILSPVKSWAIMRDGLLRIKQDTIGKPSTDPEDDRVVVDALDATIIDLDNESIKLTKTGKTGSYLRKGDYIYSRFRSEFGGRGGPSSSTRLQETESYIAEVGNSLKRKFFACDKAYQVSNDISQRYYPVCYMHSSGAVQVESSRENTGVDETRKLRILKNIFTYGILVKHVVVGTSAQVTIACKTGDNNHLTVGTKVGITLPRNHYIQNTNNTWVDAVIIDNPVTLPIAFSSSTCITFEYEIPATGDLAYGPVAFDPSLFDPDLGDFENYGYGSLSCSFPMWQTIDGKKYFTPWIAAPDGEGGANDKTYYTVAGILTASEPITSMITSINDDVTYSPVTFMPYSEALDDADVGIINGIYSVKNANVPQHTYTTAEPYMEYKRTVGVESVQTFCVFTGNTKSLFSSNGNLDGSIVNCQWTYGDPLQDHDSQTWFKDRWYYQKLPIMRYSEDETVKFFVAPLIVISEPHNATRDSEEDHATMLTYITAPSEKCGRRFPVNINLWYEPKYYTNSESTNNTSKLLYNPYAIIDELGDPILQNNSPSYYEDYENTLHNAMVLCYSANDLTTGDGESTYRHGYYEIYKKQIFDDPIPYKIGEEINLLKLDIDLTDDENPCINVPIYDTVNGGNFTYYLLHYPIYLSNVGVVASVVANNYTRSVGDFNSSAYFNGRFYFGSKNSIKEANEFLEWDTSRTFNVGGNIKQLISLNSMLFILTDNGIYTMNAKGEIEKFSSIKASMATAYGEKLMFVSDDQRVYHTEFSPIPVGQQWQLTENPYIIKEEDTQVIRDVAESWTVYSMASLDDKVYVASNKCVWVYHAPTKTWWEQEYAYDVLKLVRWCDKIIAIGGEYDKLIAPNVTKFRDIPLFNGIS